MLQIWVEPSASRNRTEVTSMSTIRPSPPRSLATLTVDPVRSRSATPSFQRGSSWSKRPAWPSRQISSGVRPSMAPAAGLAAVIRPSGKEKRTPSELRSNMTR